MARRRLDLLPEVLPAPPAPVEGGPRQRTLARLTRLAAATAAAAAISGCKDKHGTGGGYAVVDPMPVPARCTGAAMTIHATAKWKDEKTIELVLGKPGTTGVSYAGGPRIAGFVQEVHVTPDSVRVLLRHVQDLMSVRIPVRCEAGTEAVLARVTVKPGDSGGDLEVQLEDSR